MTHVRRRSRRGRSVSGWRRPTASYQVAWTSIARGGNWLHELRASYFPRDYTLDNPDFGGPPLAADGQLRASRRADGEHHATRPTSAAGAVHARRCSPSRCRSSTRRRFRANSHAIKFGVDGMFVDFVYLRYAGPQTGHVHFRVARQLPARACTRPTRRLFGAPQLDRYHSYLLGLRAGFVAGQQPADAELRPALRRRVPVEVSRARRTGHDRNNLGPRFAVSYDLTGKGKTLLKVSNGLYYDRIFQNPITPTFFQAKTRPAAGRPASGTSASPARRRSRTRCRASRRPACRRASATSTSRRTIMQVPMAYQIIGTLDHAFRTISRPASACSTRGRLGQGTPVRHQPRLQRRDRPIQHVRPDPSFRRILQYSYAGEAKYTRARARGTEARRGQVLLQRRRDVRPRLRSGRQLQHAGAGPARPGRRVRARASTRRTSASRRTAPTRSTASMSVSSVFRASTGFAYSAFGGGTVDFNGDGAFNDRVPATTRNQFRMPGNDSLDLRVTWTVPLEGGAENAAVASTPSTSTTAPTWRR